jgi:K+ transporter
MSELDTKIRAALAAEESALLQSFAEPSLPEQIVETFRGRNRWLVVMAFVLTAAFVGFAVFTAISFFYAESTKTTIGWASGFGLCLITIAMMKIWYWIELSKNNVLREVKRMELQVARLASQLKKPE